MDLTRVRQQQSAITHSGAFKGINTDYRLFSRSEQKKNKTKQEKPPLSLEAGTWHSRELPACHKAPAITPRGACAANPRNQQEPRMRHQPRTKLVPLKNRPVVILRQQCPKQPEVWLLKEHYVTQPRDNDCNGHRAVAASRWVRCFRKGGKYKL